MRIVQTIALALAMFLIAGCAQDLCPVEQQRTNQRFARIHHSSSDAMKKAKPSLISVTKSGKKKNGDPPVIFVTKSTNKRKPPKY